jgi:outer membrane receptor protein involved in Fe transport
MSFQPFRTGTLGIFLAAVLVTAAAHAQTVNGRFTGSVVDPSGSMVVGASITLTNEQTGDIRKSAANNSGVFTFPAVQPGQYSVKVEQQGFKSYQRKGMNLAANDVFSLGEIKLDVGAVTESVLVETQGSVVSTNSSEHSALLTANQTAMLQVRGREAMSLLKLLPGVTNITDEEAMGGSWGSTVPNIQGNRTNTNAVSVDGLATNDGGAPTQVSPINLDAVAEVKVLLNNYQAEYGRNGGAEIRIVTKSGTKDFHGTGYWYKRHEMFNANSWQNNRNNVPKPIYRYNNEGFTLGGPIYIPGKLNVNRNKLFFFYSGDLWQSYSPQALRTLTMPTQRELGGDFSQTLDTSGKLITIKNPLAGGAAFPGNIIPANMIDSNGLALLKILKTPNFDNRAVTGGNYNFTFLESLQLPKNQNVIHGDWNPTAKDKISVRYSAWKNYQNGYAASSGLANWGLGTTHYSYTDDGGTINYVHIFSPTVVNEFSAGLRHSIESNTIDADQLALIQRSKVGFKVGQLYPALNPFDVVPTASFTGVIPNGPSITYDNRFPLFGADTNFDFSDGLTWVKDKHTFKAGIYVNRFRSRKGFRAAFAGALSFSPDTNNSAESGDPFSNALLGNFTNYNESSSRWASQARTWDVEWYAQDTYRVTRRLTLDYGLRLTRYTPLVQECACSANHQNAAFDLSLYNPAQAPQLLVPGINPATKTRQAYNPLTGSIFPRR